MFQSPFKPKSLRGRPFTSEEEMVLAMLDKKAPGLASFVAKVARAEIPADDAAVGLLYALYIVFERAVCPVTRDKMPNSIHEAVMKSEGEYVESLVVGLGTTRLQTRIAEILEEKRPAGSDEDITKPFEHLQDALKELLGDDSEAGKEVQEIFGNLKGALIRARAELKEKRDTAQKEVGSEEGEGK